MEQFRRILDAEWGRVPGCAHCNASDVPLALCGGCMSVPYCSAACQASAWNAFHRYECIAGSGNKRAKGEEEDEEDRPQPRQQPRQQPAQVLTFDDLPPDVVRRFNQFLNLHDLNNLSVTHRRNSRLLRSLKFSTFLWQFPDNPADMPRFLSVAPDIRRLVVRRQPPVIALNDWAAFSSLEYIFWDISQPFIVGQLPSVTELRFGDDFNRTPDLSNVPNLTFLQFGERFRQADLGLQHVPHLQSLVLGQAFNHPLNLAPVPNLRVLDLGANFNQPLNATLAQVPMLEELLIMSDFFNQPLDLAHVPNLVYLHCGDSFNQPLNLVAVPKLLMLVLGDDFNQPLNNLASCPLLKELKVGDHFNQPIDLRHVPQLEILELGYRFNQHLELTAVPNLETLAVGTEFVYNIDLNDLPRLQVLQVSRRNLRKNKNITMPGDRYVRVIRLD